MRNIYISVIVVFLLSIFLFIGSFIYIDRTGHRIYYYTVNLDNHDIGTIKIDKFETADKIIYRSVAKIPFSSANTETKTQLYLDKKYNIDEYINEASGSGQEEYTYLKSNKGKVSFVSIFGSRFVCLEDVPIRRPTFIFKEDAPITFLPILENYDFQKGRSQGFYSLTFFARNLPPIKRFVTFTSIRDEYLKLEGRNIKSENLVLKIRNYPQGNIWVAKHDRSLLRIEIPKIGLRITRSFSPKTLEARDYETPSGEFKSRPVIFEGKDIKLSGTLSIPNSEGAHPAILLIPGNASKDIGYYGLFSSMADFFSKNGFCVLRFESRGTGKSGGSSSSATNAQSADDIRKAVEFMAAQKEVDAKYIYIIAHDRGASRALEISSEKSPIKGAVLMAPVIYPELDNRPDSEWLKNAAQKGKWSDEYIGMVLRCLDQTRRKASETNDSWANILGRKCFLKSSREEISKPGIDWLNNVKLPVLTLQGREDEEALTDDAALIDSSLEKSGALNHRLIYYSYLGHFFGKKINDGVSRIHYEIDKEVLGNILDWIRKDVEETKNKEAAPKLD